MVLKILRSRSQGIHSFYIDEVENERLFIQSWTMQLVDELHLVQVVFWCCSPGKYQYRMAVALVLTWAH